MLAGAFAGIAVCLFDVSTVFVVGYTKLTGAAEKKGTFGYVSCRFVKGALFFFSCLLAIEIVQRLHSPLKRKQRNKT